MLLGPSAAGPLTSLLNTAMPKRSRIAVVSATDTDLVSSLAELSLAPRVQRFQDLYGDIEAMRRYQPDVLFLAADTIGEEDAGGLRMLRAVMPESAVVVVCPSEREAQVRPWSERAGVGLLVEPATAAQLTAAMESRLFGGAASAETEAMLDLARGLSDEINNPLQLVAGHVRLLQHSIDTDDRDAGRRQVMLVRDGLERIAETMEEIKWLCRAADASPGEQRVDLRELLQGALEKADPRLPALSTATAPVHARAERALVEVMLEHLCAVAAVLLDTETKVEVELTATDAGGHLRLRLEGPALPSWRLPRTFEPYYLGRVLRGTPRGLSLFLVQTIARSQGGRALARLDSQGGISLEIELPG